MIFLAGPISEIKTLYNSKKTEFADELKNNQRLQLISINGVIIIYLLILSSLFNITNETMNDLQDIIFESSQLKSQIGKQNWSEREEKSKKLLGQLKRGLWAGETPGLAEADFEAWIRKNLKNNGVDVRRVQLTRAPVDNDLMLSEEEVVRGIQRIRAKVITPLKENGLVKFLNIVSQNNSWVVVEKLIIRAGRNDRIEMELSAFYLPKGGVL